MKTDKRRNALVGVYLFIAFAAIANLYINCDGKCTPNDFFTTAGFMMLVVLAIVWLMYKK